MSTIWGLTLPTREQFLHRENIHPDLKKITHIALAAIASLTIVSMFAFSAEIIVPFSLIATLAAWSFPFFVDLELEPNYDALASQFGITAQVIENFSSEANRGEFSRFNAFLDTFNDELFSLLKKFSVLRLLIPIIEKGTETGQIKHSTLKKLAQLCRLHGVFHHRYFKADIVLCSKEGEKFPYNKLTLNMSSEYFAKAFTGRFKEKQDKSISLPTLSSNAIKGLIYHLNPQGSHTLKFDAAVQLFDFGRLALMENLSNWIKETLRANAYKCSDEQSLAKFLDDIDKNADENFDEDFTLELVSIAFTAFFSVNFASNSALRYTETLFSVPFKALPLIKAESSVGAYLQEYTNCLTLTEPLTPDTLSRLKTVQSLLSQDERNKITAIQYVDTEILRESDLTELKNLFPKIQKVCFTLKESNNERNLSVFLTSLASQNITERALICGDFYNPLDFINIERMRLLDFYNLADLFAKATHLENLTEKTKIAFTEFSLNSVTYQEKAISSIVRLKSEKIVANINIINSCNSDTKYLSFKFSE